MKQCWDKVGCCCLSLLCFLLYHTAALMHFSISGHPPQRGPPSRSSKPPGLAVLPALCQGSAGFCANTCTHHPCLLQVRSKTQNKKAVKFCWVGPEGPTVCGTSAYLLTNALRPQTADLSQGKVKSSPPSTTLSQGFSDPLSHKAGIYPVIPTEFLVRTAHLQQSQFLSHFMYITDLEITNQRKCTHTSEVLASSKLKIPSTKRCTC